MKKLLIFLIILFLFGCAEPVIETVYETVYETIDGNIVPIISIEPRITTIIKDTEVTFYADIIDDELCLYYAVSDQFSGNGLGYDFYNWAKVEAALSDLEKEERARFKSDNPEQDFPHKPCPDTIPLLTGF